jgi:putative ATP-dependent endonuclease of the OLD family
MILKRLKAKGFRSLKDVEIDFEDQLTLLIGPNDAGKSSVLDLLNIVFEKRGKLDEEDFHRSSSASEPVDSIEVTLEFNLDPARDTEAAEYAEENILQIRKVYHLGEDGSIETTTEYFCEVLEDEELRIDNFESLLADPQKQIIERLDASALDDLNNAGERVEWLRNYVEQEEVPTVKIWKEAPSRSWGDFLPQFYRYSAMEYEDPASMIDKTLQQVFKSVVYEDEDNQQCVATLMRVETKAKKAINDKVSDLIPYVRKYDPQLQNLTYEPIIDFSRALRMGQFQIDHGRGSHDLSKTGDGTKRRMLTAVLDWDCEITLAQATGDSNLPPVIRGYDEPDTNLDYDAQRRMYRAISSIVQEEKTRTQAILCTHSPPMINRVPAQYIRYLNLDENGCTKVEQLETDGDEDIENFLRQLARELGITNTLMFYERCFILVEGETEENALPILYRKLFGHSPLEDGIRLINVKSNGAAKEFLGLLKHNRKELTIVFVDSDTKDTPAAKLTEDKLRGAGFDDDFINERLRYIGQQELEDAFPDEAIVRSLQARWPKKEGAWISEDISPLRENDVKFSAALKKLVWDNAEEDSEKWSKPIFGKALAQNCHLDEIPDEISELFELARSISGCE